jgi:cytochrome P450
MLGETASYDPLGDILPGPEVGEDGTNLAQMAAAGGYLLWQRELHRRYGPLVRLWTGRSTLTVSVGDPELMRRTTHLADRPSEPVAFIERLAGKSNLEMLPAGRDHKGRRRQFAELLGGKSLFQDNFPALTGYVTRLSARWAEAGERGNAVALDHDLRRLLVNMMGHLLCGQDLESMGVLERLVESLDRVQSYQPESDDLSTFTEAMAFLDGFIDRIVQGRTAPCPDERCEDLLGMMLREGFDQTECRGNIVLMLAGAMHTTSSALAWTVYLLSRHPEVAAEVRRELSFVRGDAESLRYDDLGKLPYMTQVLKESLRHYPPTFFLRSTDEPIELGGYTIPAGTTLFYAVWALHFDPNYWPEPDRFDPSRFSPAAVEPHPFAWLPFGVGSRRCVALDLAMVEMRLILASLLTRLSFDVVAGHPVAPAVKLGAFIYPKEDILAVPRPLC